jgi:HD superfamily phosphodiesterase
MKIIHKRIWQLARPYLKKGVRKDFVLHTLGVIKAMELLLKKEGGNRDVLIPAAILHDVGWARVPIKLQKSNKKNEQLKALKLHIKYAPPIINTILTKIGYNKKQIKNIVEICLAHKFKMPKNNNEKLLIDADTLSDTFKEQFESDLKTYNSTPEKLYKFREKNRFYTKTAKQIFKAQLLKIKKSIIGKKSSISVP